MPAPGRASPRAAFPHAAWKARSKRQTLPVTAGGSAAPRRGSSLSNRAAHGAQGRHRQDPAYQREQSEQLTHRVPVL